MTVDLSERLTQHERSIGVIEGKLESLATKEFVKDEIQKQTKELSDKIDKLSEALEKERSWRMKITGGASLLALLFVGVSTLVSVLVNVGIINVAK